MIYSGISTLALANILAEIISDHPLLYGLYHVSTEPISKYELLNLVNEAFGTNVRIKPFEDFVLDRSLDSHKFWSSVNSKPPRWSEMVLKMANDSTQYDRWRE